jgi:hypothetical protein
METAVRQVRRRCRPAVAMFYFHPWEFDPQQPRLPMRPLSRFRTYVGIHRTRDRLARLLTKYRFSRAIDVAGSLDYRRQDLLRFNPAD